MLNVPESPQLRMQRTRSSASMVPSPRALSLQATSSSSAVIANPPPEMANYKVYVRVRPFLSTEIDPVERRYPLPPIEIRGGGAECVFREPGTTIPKEVFHFDACFCSITKQQHQAVMIDKTIAAAAAATVHSAHGPCAVASQDTVFEVCGQPMVDAVMEGYNVSILAYGQTNSGKTFTMMGTSTNEGLIPKIARAILRQTEERTIVATPGRDLLGGDDLGPDAVPGADRSSSTEGKSPSYSPEASQRFPGPADLSNTTSSQQLLSREYSLEVSFFEIYNEAVLDLLQGGTAQHRKRKVRVHPLLGVYVEGLTYHHVVSWAQCLKIIQKGLQQRHTAATRMNEASSRSHAIFQLRVVQIEMTDIGRVERRSNVFLADLAGSERVKHSAVEGDRLREAAQINLSLTTLRRVIDALITNNNNGVPNGTSLPSNNNGNSNGNQYSTLNSSFSFYGGAPKTLNSSMSTAAIPPLNLGSATLASSPSFINRPAMIPYRDSMLTWVLSDALGGNAKSCMIATLCPHPLHAEETYNTLQYANRARSIVNSVVKNEDQTARVIRQLQEALRQQQRANAAGNAPPLLATAALLETDPRFVEQERLVESLREEQMLMLTRYSDLRDTYEDAKEQIAQDEEEKQRLGQLVKELEAEKAAALKQVGSLKDQLTQAKDRERRNVVEAEASTAHFKQKYEKERMCIESDRKSFLREQEQWMEERAALDGRIQQLEDTVRELELAKKLAVRRARDAVEPLLQWSIDRVQLLSEALLSSRRLHAISQLVGYSCSWALAATSDHARAAQLLRRNEATLQQVQKEHAQQYSVLGHVAETFLQTREYLRTIEGPDESQDECHKRMEAAGWTASGVLEAFRRFRETVHTHRDALYPLVPRQWQSVLRSPDDPVKANRSASKEGVSTALHRQPHRGGDEGGERRQRPPPSKITMEGKSSPSSFLSPDAPRIIQLEDARRALRFPTEADRRTVMQLQQHSQFQSSPSTAGGSAGRGSSGQRGGGGGSGSSSTTTPRRWN